MRVTAVLQQHWDKVTGSKPRRLYISRARGSVDLPLSMIGGRDVKSEAQPGEGPTDLRGRAAIGDGGWGVMIVVDFVR
jgi:hypothetical protein